MYNENLDKIKYVLYARKSEESEDRQVQSIDDQIRLMQKLAVDLNIKIVETIKESMSAKDPGRPEFNKMLDKIKSGEINGILCWQINRLTRNPIDSGSLQYLLQNELIKSIRCSDKQYLPGDNALIFSVETGTANQFILDLKKNTKRGLQTKLEKGWLPGPAPVGYMNDKYEDQGYKKILVDEERFTIVRKMWDLMLTGNYSVKKIYNIAKDDWKFKTNQRKRTGGKYLSYTGLCRVFNDKFYAGIITRKGKEYKGSHQPMITMGEFYKVQENLGKKEKPMAHTHDFPYTGLIRCGICGCMITAEEKVKKIVSTGGYKTYKYYRCTKRKEYINCNEKPLTENKLEDQLKCLLLKSKILPNFRDWAIEILREEHKQEIEDENKIYGLKNNNLIDLERQLDNLTILRLKDLIDDNEFINKKEKLKKDISESNVLLEKEKYKNHHWLEELERDFNIMADAYKNLDSMAYSKRRSTFNDFGQNFIIKDGKVAVNRKNSFIEVEKKYPKIEERYLRLELDKTLDSKEKIELLHSIKSVWGGIRGSNP